MKKHVDTNFLTSLKEDFEMKKTGIMFVAGLLVLVFTAAGSAFTGTSSSLQGTTWLGTALTQVQTTDTSSTTTTPFCITFSYDSQTEPDFLAGTFAEGSSCSSGTAFSAIKDGRSLSIVAVDWEIHADIIWGHGGWHGHGTTTPSTMVIRVKDFSDGHQDEGTLTEQ